MEQDKITILDVEEDDFYEVVDLVGGVSEADILPNFSDEGKASFLQSMNENIQKTFDRTRFHCVKAVLNDRVVGFSALRDNEYLTHLFIDKEHQSKGLGKALLRYMINNPEVTSVSLRSSINAVPFYTSLGFECTGPESNVKGIRYVPMTVPNNTTNTKHLTGIPTSPNKQTYQFEIKDNPSSK
ncbi:GNAT family N-acetyltransferase [Endozoicomonas sp. OPT23]|uniref:GNAT family N-acetyltransferase n=1 Tax=Endozoicomonas sp. OPT23 TaxID=2072845 RepID=UPI00129B83BC|nr:GNAT family N-acetyltransferase [Endozoicomonas sp. OPT23]MRI32496.1 GNAT family N-acetyltransferase [Endozoicomonas sp. OPT23]